MLNEYQFTFMLCLILPPTVQVNYLPLSVLVTSFKKRNVKRPLEGFGVLVPSREQENGLKTLGMPLKALTV